MSDIPSFIEPKVQSADQLTALKEAVSNLRDLEIEKRDIEERLHTVNEAIRSTTRETLPEIFASAGVTAISIEPYGNLPGYTAKLDTEFRANIAKDWDAERRAAGFNWLENHDAADLIKAVITIEFDKTEIDAALDLRRELEGRGYDIDFNMSVHHSTLTAWLRERFKANELPSNIDPIGGYVGPVVKLTPKKEK